MMSIARSKKNINWWWRGTSCLRTGMFTCFYCSLFFVFLINNRKNTDSIFLWYVEMLAHTKSRFHGPCKLPFFMISLRVLLLGIRSSVSCAGDMELEELVGMYGHYDLPLGPFTQLTLWVPSHTAISSLYTYAILPSWHEHYNVISSKQIRPFTQWYSLNFFSEWKNVS
jgi:hypothetical protein